MMDQQPRLPHQRNGPLRLRDLKHHHGSLRHAKRRVQVPLRCQTRVTILGSAPLEWGKGPFPRLGSGMQYFPTWPASNTHDDKTSKIRPQSPSPARSHTPSPWPHLTRTLGVASNISKRCILARAFGVALCLPMLRDAQLEWLSAPEPTTTSHLTRHGNMHGGRQIALLSPVYLSWDFC